MYCDGFFQQAVRKEVLNTNRVNLLTDARGYDIATVTRITWRHFDLLDIRKFKFGAGFSIGRQIRVAHVDIAGESAASVQVAKLFIQNQPALLGFHKPLHQTSVRAVSRFCTNLEIYALTQAMAIEILVTARLQWTRR
ncbi:hypothetical protein D0T23_06190 [Duganella sp. BJB475]|nr:hypothetical protein D0T23_06190 [Duganella sp. BJB475]RFP35940.1 hypothetical protein D0T21_05735 [Duganella sp. BJB476]